MKIKRYNESLGNKPKIYLAGGFGKFRDVIMNETDADWLNPENMTNEVNWFELETDAIRECDGIIAWFEKGNPSGFGMTFEMGMAFALNKPYLLILEEPNMSRKFSMQSKGAEKTFESWEDCLDFVNKTNWMNIKK